jgi:uncharacterized membrane protein
MRHSTLDLPSHIDGTVQAIAKLQNEHHQEASPIDHAIDRVTAAIGKPTSLAVMTMIICIWMGANAVMPLFGKVQFDPAPFSWLINGVGLMSLYMSTLILITQRRSDRLASRREQMTLELAFLSEHKTAKIIALLEELRLDSPDVKNRVDKEAAAMARPSDTRAVRDAIKDTHDEMIAAEAAESGKPQAVADAVQ